MAFAWFYVKTHAFCTSNGLFSIFPLLKMMRGCTVWDALNTPKLYGLVAAGTQRRIRSDALSYVSSLL
jgi:hypothetical protein